jgi:hypothetical protein
MDDRTLLALCAVHSFALAAFHLGFWKLFGWPRAYAGASLANRVVPQILNLRLIYVFLGVGALCLAFPQELAGTALGRALLLGMSGFWIGRLVEQFVFLRVNHAGVHALSVVFALGALLFAWPALS